MKLKDYINEDKPREKLIKYGPSSLSDSELLQIILRTGSKEESVNELSTRILKEVGSIKKLSMMGYNSLCMIKGIKKSKATSILCAFELNNRIDKSNDKVKLSNSDSIYNTFKHEFKGLKQEVFYLLLFDSKMNLIKKEKLFIGTVDKSTVHPREIFKSAIIESASFMVVMHNHPSGDITPSREDNVFTSNLYKASLLIGIKLVDHLIIGEDSYYSFYNEIKNINI